MDVEEAVIDRSAEEGARVVALALAADCDAAAKRLAGGKDAEALHDFRVGLRRLRTTLRAFRPWLEDSVRPRTEKRLKKLARGTNDARDAEVQLGFLDDQAHLLGSRQRAGLDFLRDRFDARRRAGEGRGSELADEYGRISRKLAKRLQTYEGHLAAASTTTFGAVVATLVRDQFAEMRARLEDVAGAGDEEHVHRARIAGKRLRYLLEPLRGNRHADAQAAVKRLKKLQDLLGDMHDAHVLSHEIASALVDAAAERARQLHAAVYDGGDARTRLAGSPRAGVLAMVRLVRERRDALFEELQRTWRGGGLDALSGEIAAVVEALEMRAGGRVETERKYLLAGLPPRAEGAPAHEIEQGWIPGERLRERVRRVRGPDGNERFWRALKHGAGPQRLEAEEETTREVFDALWGLTAGRRVRKRRHHVPDAGVVWEIDQFSDRDLVLAEVELPANAPEASPPEWLRPFVVREVTGDPAYLNETLALSGSATATRAATATAHDGEREPPSAAIGEHQGAEQEDPAHPPAGVGMVTRSP
jgi:CHAD domain-containing protein/CYTH domain-containing protein